MEPLFLFYRSSLHAAFTFGIKPETWSFQKVGDLSSEEDVRVERAETGTAEMEGQPPLDTAVFFI